ncbi:MAG: polyphosphate kinase 1 [Gammaproteobacteria bacterium]|nr:polyphosphate kinase 1 [Gammaproteobacteria bacterium]
MDAHNLNLPEHYINRELSVLEFQRRVLALAGDPSVPLLERLKFLCIVSTNLDEFFEIRVSGLMQRREAGAGTSGPEMMSAQQALNEIGIKAGELVAQQYRLLNDEIIPQLGDSGIHFIRREDWNEEQRAWLRDYFRHQVVPTLSPISLDPARPFPRILNKSLNFIVGLDGIHAFGRPCDRAIVQAPRSLPRLIHLPPGLTDTGENDFVFLSSIIHAFVDELFVGVKITGCYQFRITRNSDMYVDDEEVDNLMRAIEGELASNRYGAAVRMELAHNCPDDLARYLLDVFELDEQDLYRVEGPVNLNRTLAVYDLTDREDLKYPPFTPGLPDVVLDTPSIFDLMSRQELLLHHPYESFSPVVDLISRASKDPDVVAIKMTLYRAGEESTIVDHLVAAAQAGKEVTVVVELRARFDEAANIAFANRLQEVGAHVVYGVVGFKTHCKMTLIVRRENEQLRRYAHLGTGNYHPGTARAYTDYGYFTTDDDLTEDVQNVFLQLTSMTQTPPLRKLVQAPFKLHDHLLRLIENEISAANSGGTGHIIAKINALVEPEIIHALYRASCAGVIIDLVVRSICCLRPGIPGVSDNIRVRSIVGRFLEHSRVYYFHAGGKEKLYLASADWMDRNVFRRVEVCFPIEQPQMKSRLMADLDLCLQDNMGAWELQSDGSWSKRQPGPGEEPVSVQYSLLEQTADQRLSS